MAKRTAQVNTILRRYRQELSKRIKIDSMFLFGSAARGFLNKDSDIDLLVLSKDFLRWPFIKRLEMLSRVSWCCADQRAMDILGYTPREFAQLKKSDSPIIQQILREGRFVKV